MTLQCLLDSVSGGSPVGTEAPVLFEPAESRHKFFAETS